MMKPSRDDLIQTLRGLLGEAFALHRKGAAGARLGRSYGMADGYMRALLDLGFATPKQLGVIVAEERTRALGAATTTLEPELPASTTIAA